MSLSAILTAATGAYFFVLPNEFPMQKKCLGFLFTNYVTFTALDVFISFIKEFEAGSGERRSEEMEPTSLTARICKYLSAMVYTGRSALVGVPVSVLLLLVASTNVSDHTMQMLAVAPFIPLLIDPLPIPYRYHQMIKVWGGILTAIVGVGASVSMVKSEFF